MDVSKSRWLMLWTCNSHSNLLPFLIIVDLTLYVWSVEQLWDSIRPRQVSLIHRCCSFCCIVANYLWVQVPDKCTTKSAKNCLFSKLTLFPCKLYSTELNYGWYSGQTLSRSNMYVLLHIDSCLVGSNKTFDCIHKITMLFLWINSDIRCVCF